MIFAADYIRTFIEGLTFSLDITSVEEIGPDTKISTPNTLYVTDAHKIVFDGVIHRVLSFVENDHFVLEGVGLAFAAGTKTAMSAPTFFHGQFFDTAEQMAKRKASSNVERRDYMPMVYMLEPSRGLQSNSDPLSRFALEGEAKLFILNSTKWTNTPEEHYEKNIRPLGAIIDAMEAQYANYFHEFEGPALEGVVIYPKFVTGNKNFEGDKGEPIFGEFLSGIEVVLNVKIPRVDPNTGKTKLCGKY
jgi:hypothetical protein